jgi:voltage-gated potassium channel
MSGMLPATIAKMVESLLGRGERSNHWRAVGWTTVILAVTTFLGSWVVLLAERDAPKAGITTYPKALWWSAETATTVGYGDLYPVTFWGRVIAIVVMGIGITTYGMATAAVATWFVGREQLAARALRPAGADAAAAERRGRRGQQAAARQPLRWAVSPRVTRRRLR